MSNQPVWQYVGNLGDQNPIDHGGLFVFIDKTGVYPPEMERLWMPVEELDEDKQRFTTHRVVMDKCTFIDGVLSDNKFHPDKPAWFAKGFKDIASYSGETVDKLIQRFCSDDPLERGRAYLLVGEYYGWENLDSYPNSDLTRNDVIERFKDCKPR